MAKIFTSSDLKTDPQKPHLDETGGFLNGKRDHF
jgi:hypothetical protein